MSDAHLFAIGVVLAWLAGIRVYLTVFGVGLAGALGWLDLPPALQVTQSPWVIGVSGALAAASSSPTRSPASIRAGTCCIPCCACRPARSWPRRRCRPTASSASARWPPAPAWP